jgi:hypothetical protein
LNFLFLIHGKKYGGEGNALNETIQ